MNKDTARQIRLSADIVAIIGGEVQLKRDGPNWKAPCPFHDDRTASFTVYPSGSDGQPDGAHFHCFGCNAHGSIIDWVMRREGLAFKDAANKLGARLGIDTSSRAPGATQDACDSPPRATTASQYRPAPQVLTAEEIEIEESRPDSTRPEPGPRDPVRLAGEYGLQWDDFTSAGFTTTNGRYRNDAEDIDLQDMRWISYPIHCPGDDLATSATLEKRKTIWRNPSGKRDSRIFPAGTGRTGLIGAQNLTACTGATLVFTGGEEKMLAATVAGFPAVSTMAGEKAPSPEIAAWIASFKPSRVIVAFDADRAGAEASILAARAFRKAGIEDVRVVKWPASAPRGTDLNSILARDLGNTDALQELLSSASTFSEKGSTASTNTDEQDWPDPIPLVSDDIPEIPLDTLPVWASRYIREASHEIQVPPDLCLIVHLTLLALAWAGKAHLHITDKWSEQLNLYGMGVLRPGNRKTSVLSAFMGPAYEYQREYMKRATLHLARQKATAYTIDSRIKHLKRLIDKEKGVINEELHRALMEAENEKAALGEYRVGPRLLLDDVTPEQLGIRLAANNGRGAIISDEASLFENTFRYAKAGSPTPNLGIYLGAHVGSPVQIERVGRTATVDTPTLSIMLMGQPKVIADAIQQKANVGRGLLARFLYVWPTSWLGYRETNPELVRPETQIRYANAMHLNFTAGSWDMGEKPPKNRLELSPEAHAAIDAFREETEPEFRTFGIFGDEEGSMSGWGSKLAGHIARIAALLHLSQSASEGDRSPWQAPVPLQHMENAIAIGRALIPHAQKTFGEILPGTDDRNAAKVLEWFRSQPAAPFYSHRDLQQGVKRTLGADDIVRAARKLEECHYIRRTEVKTDESRQKKVGYTLHPLVAKGKV